MSTIISFSQAYGIVPMNSLVNTILALVLMLVINFKLLFHYSIYTSS